MGSAFHISLTAFFTQTSTTQKTQEQYALDLAAVHGIAWSKAESSHFHLDSYRARIHTIPELIPGCASTPFPRALQGVSPATKAQRHQLIVDYDGAIAAGHWALALRYAVIAELVRRTTRIQTARGGTYADELRFSGGLYASDHPLPLPPAELRPVFHGMAYGHRAVDIALMNAIGVRPIDDSIAGFEAFEPLYAYVRVRNYVTKRVVQVPAVIGRAWISDELLDQDDPEALARSCRSLLINFDDEGELSPLALLELHVLACIPSGQIVLPSNMNSPPRYEHLFGVANDTRHFWITCYYTDRLQLPCTPILTPQVRFEELMLEPARLAAMCALADACLVEERAMFQVMLGIWGIDRLIVGRDLVWREEEGAPQDDVRFFATKHNTTTIAPWPQWVPQKSNPAPRPRDNDDFLSARAPRRRVTFDDVAIVMPVRRLAILKARGACFGLIGHAISMATLLIIRRPLSVSSSCASSLFIATTVTNE
jgi:hypothetical protein